MGMYICIVVYLSTQAFHILVIGTVLDLLNLFQPSLLEVNQAIISLVVLFPVNICGKHTLLGPVTLLYS